MFIGHFGAGFAGKAVAARTSLGTLFLAAQLSDLLWPTFLLLGLERVAIRPGVTRVVPLDFVSYPWSHSLLLAGGWGLLFAVLYRLVRGYLRGAVVVGLLVVSHWLLDLVVHRPDLPLAPWMGVRVGLGLWSSLPATLAAELLVFGAGFAIYLLRTRTDDRFGIIAPWALAGFLLPVYAANLLGPPPPSVEAIAWTGQAQWLLVAAGYWIDRHRRGPGPTGDGRWGAAVPGPA